MKREPGRADEHGFSLMELMVAMLITLIVSGAIYGLIVSGQNAFRREPELADRQQNIRIAMDLIQRDVLLAGQGVPWLGQAFTKVDAATATDACTADLNGCGPQVGTLGAVAAAARGGGDSEVTDILETLSIEEQCPFFTVCQDGGGTDINSDTPLTVAEPTDTGASACPSDTLLNGTLLLATNNYNFAVVAAQPAAGGGDCGNGGRSFTTAGAAVGLWAANQTSPTLPQLSVPPLGSSGTWVAQARIARYQIAPDPTDGAPSLWRSTTGLYTSSGGAAGAAAQGVGTWQLIARGIEDLQVEYMDGDNAWSNFPETLNPGMCGATQPIPTDPACADQNLLVVRQVRVTLSARSMAPNMVGAVQDGNQTAGTEALRGQLSAVITPRAAKVGLDVP